MDRFRVSAVGIGGCLLASVGCQSTQRTSGSTAEHFAADDAAGAPQTVSVMASDGSQYSGVSGVSAIDNPGQPLVLFNVFASGPGGKKWSAQLSIAVEDFVAGETTLRIKPWSQAPGTGFIDDQGNPPTFSQSGTVHIKLAPGRQFTAEIATENPAFSSTVSGVYNFQCLLQAAPAVADGGPFAGEAVDGAVAMDQDPSLTSTFCSKFARLAKG